MRLHKKNYLRPHSPKSANTFVSLNIVSGYPSWNARELNTVCLPGNEPSFKAAVVKKAKRPPPRIFYGTCGMLAFLCEAFIWALHYQGQHST
jgi:hypothetical protein